MHKLPKFEAFTPQQVDSDLYLHSQVNEPKPPKAEVTDPLRQKLKNLSWTELTTEDSSMVFITYSLPAELYAEVKAAYKVHDPILEIYIDSDDGRNRTHSQIDQKLRGLGLIYKCYKATVEKLGYITSSDENSTADAKNLWKGLIQDPMYYAALTQDKVIIISKALTDTKIKEIMVKFLGDTKRWKADEDLLVILNK
jgi:hypothetical protein